MNKQQLASTIWQSANQMRSKIEANEYKDYILGFMFYKYLSDREVSFLKGEKYSDEDIKKVTANDEKLVKHISENIGYFIAYEDLFSTWLSKGDPGVVDVALKELHRSFSMLSQEEQRYAERFIHAVESGQAKLVPGKTFRDYITDYMKADEDARINRVVRRLGCYYALLKELLDRHATPRPI